MRAIDFALGGALLWAAACGGGGAAAPDPSGASDTSSTPSTAAGAAPVAPVSPDAQPDDYITVDHILIGIASPQLPAARRNAAEARQFAYELLEQIRAGGDWDKLKQAHSDDRGPGRPVGGPYTMSNHGLPKPQSGMERRKMVPAFGNVGWALAVGEVGIADHHPTDSPFGYHIIKRLPCIAQRPLMAGAQHILVQWRGIQGAPPNVTRSKEEAKALADRVQALAAADGADWAALVVEHTDDRRSAPREGWIGVAVHGQVGALLLPVADALFAVPEGGITPVVETSIGFHVARRASALLAVRASHILINWKGAERAPPTVTRSPDEAKAIAQDLLARLQAGADFAELARAHSDGPSKTAGGNVDWVERGGGFAYPFERAAFELRVGQISGLVESVFGWHIIKRTG